MLSRPAPPFISCLSILPNLPMPKKKRLMSIIVNLQDSDLECSDSLTRSGCHFPASQARGSSSLCLSAGASSPVSILASASVFPTSSPSLIADSRRPSTTTNSQSSGNAPVTFVSPMSALFSDIVISPRAVTFDPYVLVEHNLSNLHKSASPDIRWTDMNVKLNHGVDSSEIVQCDNAFGAGISSNHVSPLPICENAEITIPTHAFMEQQDSQIPVNENCLPEDQSNANSHISLQIPTSSAT